MPQQKRIMVDMSVSLLHHGHIRILRAASELGKVIVALTTDDELQRKKGYVPELDYAARKEILEAIRYVDEVVPSNWLIDDDFLARHGIDLLVHGSDNSNPVAKDKLVILPRTEGISSEDIRQAIRNS